MTRSASWFRRLLFVLPSDLRGRDGPMMTALHERLVREARVRGRWVAAGVALRSASDLIVHGVRERWRRVRAARGVVQGWGRPDVESLLVDVRHAVRSLARRPAFSLLAGLTFALGIGANTAVFSVVNGVLLRPLPYEAPDRIVRLMGVRGNDVNFQGTLAFLNYEDVAARASSFTHSAAYDEWQPNLTGSGDPIRLDAAQVNAGFFDVFGVQPAVGRFFRAEEDVDGRDRVVVLSWGLYQGVFGGDPSVVGRTVDLDGNAHEVVGVAPASFEDPQLSGPGWMGPALWRPLGYGGVPMERRPSRSSSSFVAIARLAPGVSLEQARQELAAISRALEAEFPEQNESVSMTALPLRDTIVGDVRGTLLLLLAAVAFVLAIAAANVGNLVLGRATERRQEMALRSALGASVWRTVRPLLAETLVLAFVGGAGGLALAAASTRALVSLGGEFIPRGAGVLLDGSVFTFALGVTLLAGLLCSVVPAVLVAASPPRAALGEASRGGTASRGSRRYRSTLIVAEVALALMLLVGASLLGRSLWRLTRVDVGLDTGNLLTFDLAPTAAAYPERDHVDALLGALLERLRALPGVETVGTINILPLSGSFDCNRAHPAGQAERPARERLCAQIRTVTPGYFASARITPVQGRLLRESDRTGVGAVAVITEALATTLWPGQDPIGRSIATLDTVVEVVGIVPDVKHVTLDEPAPPFLYFARAQAIVPWHERDLTVVVRTRSDPLALATAARAAVHALDPLLPVSKVRTMEQLVARSAAPPRFRTLLFASFALVALLLATVGIYGVVSSTVAQRSSEVAIRMALGARSNRVLRMVVLDSLLPVLLGLALGWLGALALSRVLAALLFDVAPTDPVTFLGVPALMFTVGALAALGPARRATRADPMTVLRQA